MRGLTFLGLIMIAVPLREIAKMESLNESAGILTGMVVICIIMDLVEFFHKLNK